MGYKIKVELSRETDQDKGDGGEETSREIFVANIHADINEDELSKIFSRYGEIVDILLVLK